MKFSRFIILILITFYSIPAVSFAQYSESIDSDATYMAKMMQLDSLKRVQSDMVQKLATLREKATEQQSDGVSYIDSVLNMENTLFTLRGEIGILTTECQEIEQMYIIRDLNKNNKKQDDKAIISYTRLVDNKFFRDNLSEKDMNFLLSEVDKDSLYMTYRDSLFKSVDIIQRVDRLMRITPSRIVADSLQYLALVEEEKIMKYEESLQDGWEEMFSRKIELYNVLLDKLNVPISDISDLANRLRDIKIAREEVNDKKLSVIFHSYSIEKELILSYEKILAEKLAYISSLDSIKVSLKRLSGQRFDVNKIELPKLNYVVVEGITIGGQGVHSTRNPIKDVVVPSYGTIYMVRVFSLKNKLKYISSLKEVNPVYLFRSETGMYEYYAGIYTTKQDALRDMERLSKMGFNTEIAEWREGGKVNSDGVIIPADVYSNKYRIAFDNINDTIKDAIRRNYPKMSIVKIDGRYSLGYFFYYLDAVKAQKLVKNSEIIAIPK